MAFSLYDRCPVCRRQHTTHSPQIAILDRYDPETNWHPVACGRVECAEAIRSNPFFPHKPLPHPLRREALSRRFLRYPVHRRDCRCGSCSYRREQQLLGNLGSAGHVAPAETQRVSSPETVWGPEVLEARRRRRLHYKRTGRAAPSAWDPD